jgi:hypothetical protein
MATNKTKWIKVTKDPSPKKSRDGIEDIISPFYFICTLSKLTFYIEVPPNSFALSRGAAGFLKLLEEAADLPNATNSFSRRCLE